VGLPTCAVIRKGRSEHLVSIMRHAFEDGAVQSIFVQLSHRQITNLAWPKIRNASIGHNGHEELRRPTSISRLALCKHLPCPSAGITVSLVTATAGGCLEYRPQGHTRLHQDPKLMALRGVNLVQAHWTTALNGAVGFGSCCRLAPSMPGLLC
jgi:hypothetical protein